ncbi:ribonucleases P/MRP protein subunit POP1 [Microplitis demolitor]|uniref:ribonucleases P/MRP protein subunit POP1 n=1 Tax=Microplitis demolitor TaxID=69319 RepID=UPI0004CD28ED|nr:ribonucleases P/MRP protein subunit POP1 [Microplitis demolitor]
MDKPQFDEFLGGSVSLPRDVEINKLAAARANEIAAMTYAIENPQQTKLIFQRLPIHMRRRVMSHNAKRMPRRLREAHKMQMEKSGKPGIPKRPSRKYRRRPHNLLSEYKRRQRKCAWLETHIWHAKRFHMTEKWGYKIANFSNDKATRSSYRTVKGHCTIQDISYYSCIELKGPEEILMETLKVHCKYEKSFGANAYKNGDRQGSLTFYRTEGCPVGVINFMWRPDCVDDKIIWIWVHPALVKDVLDELVSSLNLVEVLSADSAKTKSYRNSTGCSLEFLTLNRFRLRGPMAPTIITDALRCPSFTFNQEESSNPETMEVDVAQPWQNFWYQEPGHRKSFIEQKDIFEKVKELNSPDQFPRHGILGLTVLDPRFYFPAKRTKVEYKSLTPTYDVINVDKSTAASPLWESSVREDVKKNFKSTEQINKLRSGNLVPGVENDSGFNEDIITKVPIILVQHPGTEAENKSIGFNSGIDIILPAGWALAFWLSFVYRCARPIGLREYRSAVFESMMLNQPEVNHPDTAEYKREAEEMQIKLKDKYFRYPPNRRVNFTKLSISSPFNCEWGILIKEWTDKENLQVLRDPKIINSLSQAFNSFNNRRNRKSPVSTSLNFNDSAILDKSCLVTVKVTVETKGKPNNFSIICLPTEEDLKKFNDDRKWGGPIEKKKTDKFEAQRKALRIKHKLLLKRERRKRILAKKALQTPIPLAYLGARKLEQKKIMDELYLQKCTSVRNSCDREVIGYVVQGGFSFSECSCFGWGYVVALPLLDLLKIKNNMVLVRNTQTRQYRCARLDIVNLYA